MQLWLHSLPLLSSFLFSPAFLQCNIINIQRTSSPQQENTSKKNFCQKNAENIALEQPCRLSFVSRRLSPRSSQGVHTNKIECRNGRRVVVSPTISLLPIFFSEKTIYYTSPSLFTISPANVLYITLLWSEEECKNPCQECRPRLLLRKARTHDDVDLCTKAHFITTLSVSFVLPMDCYIRPTVREMAGEKEKSSKQNELSRTSTLSCPSSILSRLEAKLHCVHITS